MAQTTWTLDPAHSELLFKVKHLMIANVKGEFRSFDAKVVTDGDDFATASVTLEIDPSSIFTNSDDRDKHLRSADFFDVENHKVMRFESTGMRKIDDENYKLQGVLTMKDVSKEVQLDVEFGGMMKDPYGNEKAGFSLNGTINRRDWGLNWNAALETGGVLVSDEVRLSADVQFIKQSQN